MKFKNCCISVLNYLRILKKFRNIHIYIYIIDHEFELILKWMLLRIKWHRGDLAIYYLLQIIHSQCGRFWMQYRVVKHQINIHMNDKVYFVICERN